MQILVTGGLGYIGSHTSVELISKGFDVVIVDDLSNSKLNVFDKIKKITGKNPNLEIKDLKNKSEVKKLFSDYRFDGIIHFAAHKSVNESVNFPEKYYKNNIGSLENLLENIDEKMHFIFSSSCTVYGQADKMPIKEDYFHALNAIHGSVYFKMLDDAAFFAAQSVVEDYMLLTANFNISFKMSHASGL